MLDNSIFVLADSFFFFEICGLKNGEKLFKNEKD